MEVNLKREAIQYCTPVYSDTLIREESLETVVSDTLPDIARILDADAAVYLRTKTLQQGKVRIEGSIRGTVLYIGEDSERLQKIETELPVTFTADADGTEDADVLAANVCVSSVDAKLLNPRKILFRASVCAAVVIYRSVTASLPAEAEPTAGLYTLTDTKTVSFLAGVDEKSFLVSDEAELPAGCPPMEKLLCYSHTETVDELKQVGGKMILQGTVRLDTLYLTAADDAPQHQTFRIPFSQILDISNGKAELSTVILTSGGCYLEPLSGSDGITSLHLELHLCAQTLCRSETEIRYIADAYSLKNVCRLETDSVCTLCVPRPTVLRQSLRETMETPDTPKEILYTRVTAAFPVCTEKGATENVCVRVLFRTQRGSISAMNRVVPLTFEGGAASGTSLPETARFGDIYAAAGENAVELRCPVELPLDVSDSAELMYVSAMELEEDDAAEETERPSLIVIRLGTDSLWSIAKKYGSTCELIESANPGTVNPGDLLLIPHGR